MGDASWSPFPRVTYPRAVDCNAIGVRTPVVGAFMNTVSGQNPYLVSVGWWEKSRLDEALAAAAHGRKAVMHSGPDVNVIQRLNLETAPGAAMVDVGANVGFMTFVAPASGRPVFAIEPHSYNVAKLCEGWWLNLVNRTIVRQNLVHIFHAAAGATYRPHVTLFSGPDHHDQASLSEDAVIMRTSPSTSRGRAGHLRRKRIPMLTVDSIVPDDVPIGVVKIDVQGHETAVIRGMSSILQRRTGYPEFIYFEHDPNLIRKAGGDVDEPLRLLTAAGYHCKRYGENQLCSKSQSSIKRYTYP
jgi:FkbM family methyltransferase